MGMLTKLFCLGLSQKNIPTPYTGAFFIKILSRGAQFPLKAATPADRSSFRLRSHDFSGSMCA